MDLTYSGVITIYSTCRWSRNRGAISHGGALEGEACSYEAIHMPHVYYMLDRQSVKSDSKDEKLLKVHLGLAVYFSDEDVEHNDP
jgi:hypothetical protein